MDFSLPPALPKALLSWYDANARQLPWRENADPYRVWVSEIMLQQTRVETVIPYYRRFLAALPTVEALAAVPEQELLKLWEGLGYYSRARQMQRAARCIVEDHGGRFPASYEALKALPGVGDYTAGAIGSIAFGLPVPAVDGNVLRVLSRLLNSSEDVADPLVRRGLSQALSEVIPQDRPGDFNQALMDLGAMICGPGPMPRCPACPLRGLCRGLISGEPGRLPVKAPRPKKKLLRRTVFILTCGGRVALKKRPPEGLLAGLWELPGVEAPVAPEDVPDVLNRWGLSPEGRPAALPPKKHVFTHLVWEMNFYLVPVRAPGGAFTWATAKELRETYALPSAFKPVLPAVLKALEAQKPDETKSPR